VVQGGEIAEAAAMEPGPDQLAPVAAPTASPASG
jgi:hypothetical protein